MKTIQPVSAEVAGLVAKAEPVLVAARETRDVLVGLDGRTLTGSVASCTASGWS